MSRSRTEVEAEYNAVVATFGWLWRRREQLEAEHREVVQRLDEHRARLDALDDEVVHASDDGTQAVAAEVPQ
jgi:uncharacterized coiled-coil DUF342 family protein